MSCYHHSGRYSRKCVIWACHEEEGSAGQQHMLPAYYTSLGGYMYSMDWTVKALDEVRLTRFVFNGVQCLRMKALHF